MFLGVRETISEHWNTLGNFCFWWKKLDNVCHIVWRYQGCYQELHLPRCPTALILSRPSSSRRLSLQERLISKELSNLSKALISGGLKGCWLGYSQGPPPFRGPPISKSVKKSNVWIIHNTVYCKRHHRQSGLISTRTVLTHWTCFVDVKVVDSLACGLADTH